jgi:hypothetical protein
LGKEFTVDRRFCAAIVLFASLVAVAALGPPARTQNPAKPADEGGWTMDFPEERGDLGPTGRNRYFILEPGYQMVLRKGDLELIKAVLPETRMVDGVLTRVVEERESKKGKVIEVARNFYAISKKTNNVYYFGEEVDFYEDGKVVGHEGAWVAGAQGARYGLMIPAIPLVGAKFYQEIAPKVAEDRAEIVSVRAMVETPAGTFKDCVKVKETTPLEPDVVEYKYYAPGIGLVADDKLELVQYGFLKSK